MAHLNNLDCKIMILKYFYKLTHPGVSEERIPYWYKRSIIEEIWHIIRKGICQNIAPNCVLAPVRKTLYRLCGFRIGKGGFIGMKCYFDDLCVENMVIGDNVIISYGVYFACHGRKQSHNKIIIRNGVYIGMRANITARHDIEIGEGAVIGASTLVNKSVPAGVVFVGVPGRIIESNKSK